MTVSSPAPANDRLGAVMRGAFSHDALNMHFYGVFRKVEPDGNQLVGKAELQRLEHMFFAWRKVDHRFLRHNPGGAVTFVSSEHLGRVGAFRYRLEARRSILPNDR